MNNQHNFDDKINYLLSSVSFGGGGGGSSSTTSSGDYQKQLSKHGFKVSMSGKGKCYDNSMAETFFKSIKAELIWRNRWETRRQAEGAIFNYISGVSNPRRHHSSLGGKSPLAFEQKATSMELIDRDPSPTRTVTAKCQCHSPQLRKVFQLHSFWPICQSAIRNSPAF